MTNKTNITKLLDDPDYFSGLFNQKIKSIDPSAEKVLFHQLFFIKRHVAEDFFHYVVEHRLTIELENKLKRRFRVYTISFSDHGRRKMYTAMELIYRQGFSSGAVVIPQPLWYEEEIMALFYLGIPGDTMLEHLKNGQFDRPNIKKISQGLKRLHTINYPKDVFNIHDFSLVYLDPTNVLNRQHNITDPLRDRVYKQLAELKKIKDQLIIKKNVLSHGDFHPENVIVNRFENDKLAFIDFSEVCLAPKYYDAASFLMQLELMSQGYLDKKDYDNVENIFLKNYFGLACKKQNTQNKINLYKAWTALKNAVFSMIFIEEHNRHYASYLIDLSERLSQKIK